MANTSATRQQAAHTTYQLSPPSCSTRAIQKTNKKQTTKTNKKQTKNKKTNKKQKQQKQKLSENFLEIKKIRKKKNTETGIMDYKVKNLKTERARGLRRKKKKKKGDRKGESNEAS